MEDIWPCRFPYQEILNEKFKDYSCYPFHESGVLIVCGFQEITPFFVNFWAKIVYSISLLSPWCLQNPFSNNVLTSCTESILILMVCVFSIFAFVSLARVWWFYFLWRINLSHCFLLLFSASQFHGSLPLSPLSPSFVLVLLGLLAAEAQAARLRPLLLPDGALGAAHSPPARLQLHPSPDTLTRMCFSNAWSATARVALGSLHKTHPWWSMHKHSHRITDRFSHTL